MKETDFFFQFKDEVLRGDQMTREQLFAAIESLIQERAVARNMNGDQQKFIGNVH